MRASALLALGCYAVAGAAQADEEEASSSSAAARPTDAFLPKFTVCCIANGSRECVRPS